MKTKLSILILTLGTLFLFGQSAWNPVIVGGGGGGRTGVTSPPLNPKDFGAFGDGASHPVSGADVTANQNKWLGRIVRTVTDGVTTNAGTTITSATANFVAADKGCRVTGSGISVNTWISSVTNSTTVVLNRPATASASGVTLKFGEYEAGDQWDYIGIQEAIWHAFGGPYATLTGAPAQGVIYHNNAGSWHNKAVRISGGLYKINKSLEAIAVSGFGIIGDGKQATQIHQIGTDTGHLYWDGVAYGRLEGIGFYNDSNCLSTGTNGAPLIAQMDLDWTGIHSTLKPQQITIADCAFYGNNVALTGLRICNSGSGSQGDTILISNCYFGGFKFAGLQIGFPNTAFNAMAIIVHGGCIQGCTPYGIYNYAGQVIVDGTNFENQGSSPTQQIESGGADYGQYGDPGTASILRGVRSESYTLSNGAYIIENCDVHASGFSTWAANHAYTAGTIIIGATSALSDGRAFLCVKSGTSGGTEPTWSTIPHGDFNFNTSINSGSTSLTVQTPDYFHVAYAVGHWVKVNGAGVGGAPLFAKVTGGTAPNLTIDTAASTTVSGKRINYGASIVDGTTEWIEYMYYVINDNQGLPVQIINNNYLPYGRLGLWLSRDKTYTVTNNVFTRSDWLLPNEFTKSGVDNPFPAKYAYFAYNNTVRHGPGFSGSNTNWPYEYFGGQTFTSIMNLCASPLVWRNGWSVTGVMYPDVGFARGDGSTSALNTVSGQTRNVVGVIGTLGKITPSTADTAGATLAVHGGAGTGNAGGGSIRFRTQPAGGPSGKTVPDAVDALDIGNTQRVTVYKAARITPTTYANRIASAVEGDMMYFTDSTVSAYGATIAGGGANHVLGIYNGTNWVVH